MSWLKRGKLKELLLELVRQPSISGTKQEAVMADKIIDILKRIDYFQKNPHNLFVKKLENDPRERKLVAAFLRGKDCSDKTVILLGHMDVVDVEDYGEDKELAFKPEKLTGKMNEKIDSLPGEVKDDIRDGDYLFGRGISDMKAGQAVQMALLQYFSTHQDQLPGNLIFLSVPDEETSSRGAINSVHFLHRIREKHNLEYRAVINCEPVFQNFPGDRGKYIYTGSAGKCVVFFYCSGVETHATEMFSGLNGNLFTAKIMYCLEGNLNFCEQLGDLITSPPSCLKLKDNKELYSAQTPQNSVCYFNIPILTSDPQKLLHRLRDFGQQKLKEVLEEFEQRRKEFFRFKSIDYQPLQWEGEVYSYRELYNEVYRERGEDLVEKIKGVYENNKDKIQQQEMALKIVERVNNLSQNNNPRIIVGFLPPYYPAILTEEEKRKDKRLTKTARGIAEKTRREYDEDMAVCRSYLGISDLSYYRLMNYRENLDYLQPNMPTWGLDYELPLAEINKLDIPVMNLGVYGRDSHKRYERVEQNFSLGVLPELLKYAVIDLLKDSG